MSERDPVGDWLWDDLSIFQRRRERDAAALVVLAGVLARRRELPGADEFCAYWAFVSGLDPAEFTRVVTDPYTHFWLRIAFDLMQAVARGGALPASAEALARDLGCDEPARLLGLQLDQFKRVALGAALVAGAKLELRSPLVAGPNLALPGADAAIESSQPGAISGVVDGRVLDDAGRALPLVPCPVARCGEVALPLQAHGYSVPGMGWAPPAAQADLAFQAQKRALVERGLALVARHAPHAFAQIPSLLRWFAVNPVGDAQGENFASYSELPGAIAVLAMELPHVIAAATVHELHHNRLFFLEELEPLLEAEQVGTRDQAVFYSPWREDPRPLRGVLHGAYVYVPEGCFWLDVLCSSSDADPIHRMARDRCARIPLQLELGLRQLERHARFTPRGRTAFARIAADARALAAEMRSRVDPARSQAVFVQPDGALVDHASPIDGRPLTSLRLVAEHVERFDPGHQLPPEWLLELGLT